MSIRFLINQCQIITFLILKYNIIENSKIELRGIVLPVQMVDYWGGGGGGGGGDGGGKGYVAPPPLKLLGGPDTPLHPPSYAYATLSRKYGEWMLKITNRSITYQCPLIVPRLIMLHYKMQHSK